MSGLEVTFQMDPAADDDGMARTLEEVCSLTLVLVVILMVWSYIKRFLLRRKLERELGELHGTLSRIAHTMPVQSLDQAYLAPGYRALAAKNNRGMKLGLRLAREGMERVKRLGTDNERIRQVLSQAHGAYQKCRATGSNPSPQPLKQAQAAANQGLPADQVHELATRALATYRGFLEVCEEVRHNLDELSREIERVKPYLAVEQAITNLEQGKAAWLSGKIDLADRLAYGTLNQLRSDLKQAQPELVAQIEREIPAGLWFRAKLKVSNVGRAHAREVRIRLEGIESQPLASVESLPAGESVELDVALRATQPGTLPLTIILNGARIYDNGLVSCEQSEWLEVKAGPMAQTSTSDREWQSQRPSEPEIPVKLLRETEFYRGYVRVKVAAQNLSDRVVTDVAVELLFDEKALRLNHIEPDFRLLGTKAVLGNLGPGQKRSLAFYLDPLICTHSQLDGTMVYKDIQGKLHLAKMHSKLVKVVCPIFVTPESANVATLTNLVQEVLEHSDSKVYNLPPALKPAEAFTLAREVLGGREIQHVRNFCTPQPYTAEAWYYGKTKVKGHELVMRVAVDESTNSIELYAAAPAQEPLTGLLAEMGHDLHQRMEAKGWPVKQITNVTIRDSVLNRTSLLFNPPDETQVVHEANGTTTHRTVCDPEDDVLSLDTNAEPGLGANMGIDAGKAKEGDPGAKEDKGTRERGRSKDGGRMKGGKGTALPSDREVNIRIEDAVINRSTIKTDLQQGSGRTDAQQGDPEGAMGAVPPDAPDPDAMKPESKLGRKERRRKRGQNSLDEGLEKLREIERELS